MNKKISATDLFLAMLAILLISVSFYQTWLGLQQIFGGASFIIALVLSLLLLFLCWIYCIVLFHSELQCVVHAIYENGYLYK